MARPNRGYRLMDNQDGATLGRHKHTVFIGQGPELEQALDACRRRFPAAHIVIQSAPLNDTNDVIGEWVTLTT